MQPPPTGERFVPGCDGPGIHLEHLHRYLAAAELVDGRVLDLGCGVGYGARRFGRRAREVVAADRSLVALRYARSQFGASHVHHLATDARILPFATSSFDWVVCFEVIEHLTEGGELLDEVGRVLRPEGRLLLSTPNRPVYSEARGYVNPFHFREYDVEGLRGLLAARFRSVHIFGQRLVAGSVSWELGREEPVRRVYALRAESRLAGAYQDSGEPTYLLAFCALRRGIAPPQVFDSLLSGKLDAFLEEHAERLHEVEEVVRAEYESASSRMAEQLARFDGRIRELGTEVERREATRRDEVARLSLELAAERTLRDLAERRSEADPAELAALRERVLQLLGEFEESIRLLDERTASLESRRMAEVDTLREELEAVRARAASLDTAVDSLSLALELRGEVERRLEGPMPSTPEQAAEPASEESLEELHATLEAVRRDLYWSYARWQDREKQLASIHGSGMWRWWMRYHAVRRGLRLAVTSPLRAAAGVPALVGRSVAPLGLLVTRSLGWCYLGVWTAGALLASRAPGRRRAAMGEADLGREVRAYPSRRPRVLLVSPYKLHPPDHGGGVRILNLVRRLSRHCDLHLLIFDQDGEDAEQRAALDPYARTIRFHHWRPAFRRDPWGLVPRGAQLFADDEAARAIDEILDRERIDILQLEYTELGQYGMRDFARAKVVLTEIDVSFRSRLRRRQAGFHHRYDLDRVFGYSLTDWMRLFRFELRVVRRADQVHVMSDEDGAYLARYLTRGWEDLQVVPNAVDLDEYRPPPDPGVRGHRLLFVGNFEHIPNLDALDYLVEEIWPEVRRRVPKAELLVVGARASHAVGRHDGRDGVIVVGRVPETLPYYQRCHALVAPIRAGSGTRLKILEALACGTPVVTTSIGAEGIDGTPGRDFLIADSAAEMADAIHELLTDDALCARLARHGRRLVEAAYCWDRSAELALAGYARLLTDGERAAERLPAPRGAAPPLDVSVVVPTRAGGELLTRCLSAVRAQRTRRSVEIVCVDSGSPPQDLAAMEGRGARIVPIDPDQFNHGLTRDLGAAQSRGRVVVFLNQDAVPCGEDWLEKLLAPLGEDRACAAVQGAILEVPDRGQRFYWDSGGERFYFTRESRRWIARYHGIGFSTVNAAIRREVWERYPFGWAPIMEDKKWQRCVVDAGYRIAVADGAAVHHTHDYGMRALVRRCHSEGYGWRIVGERYTLGDMLRDAWQPRMLSELARGVVRGEVRTLAEALFPWVRPWMVYRGNRWGRGVRL